MVSDPEKLTPRTRVLRILASSASLADLKSGVAIEWAKMEHATVEGDWAAWASRVLEGRGNYGVHRDVLEAFRASFISLLESDPENAVETQRYLDSLPPS